MAMVELEPVPEEEELLRSANITRAATSRSPWPVDVMSDMTATTPSACTS
jgi:hypothetical protein